jgi:hypothetical protein
MPDDTFVHFIGLPIFYRTVDTIAPCTGALVGKLRPELSCVFVQHSRMSEFPHFRIERSDFFSVISNKCRLLPRPPTMHDLPTLSIAFW